ncbi:MAG: hypothetical protein HY293_07680 [Planctomycetes bacterium]|nr:hypothetical protein [Planctomycetota bacterium]
MDSPARPRRAFAEIAAAVLVLAWRAAALPVSLLGSDWLSLLAAFWIVAVLSERSRLRPWITSGAMALLLVIYLWGQIPAAAAFLRATL